MFAVTADMHGVRNSLCQVTILTGLKVSIVITILSAKWKLLIPQYPLKKLIILTIITQYYSVVLPGQIPGEFIKMYRLAKDPENASNAVSSVITDKISGFIALVLLALIGAVHSSCVNNGIIICFIVSCAVFIVLLFTVESTIAKKTFSRLFGGLPLIRFLPGPLYTIVIDFFTKWRTFSRKPAQLFLNLILSIITQIGSVYTVVLLADDLNINIDWYNWLWIFGMVSLAVSLPISIGGLGVREGSFIALLMPFGIPSDRSMALSFLTYFFTVVIALVGCVLENKNFLKKWKK